MRRLIRSHLIRIFTVCLVNLFLFHYLKYETNKVAVRIKLYVRIYPTLPYVFEKSFGHSSSIPNSNLIREFMVIIDTCKFKEEVMIKSMWYKSFDSICPTIFHIKFDQRLTHCCLWDIYVHEWRRTTDAGPISYNKLTCNETWAQVSP